MSLGPIRSTVSNVALFSGRALVGTAGWGLTTSAILFGVGMGMAEGRDDENLERFEPTDADSRLRWYGIPIGFAVATAGLCAMAKVAVVTGGGRTLLTVDQLQSICANSVVHLGDALMITHCTLDRIGDRSLFDDPKRKIMPESTPRAVYYRGEERRRCYFHDAVVEQKHNCESSNDLVVSFQRGLLPLSIVWFGLRLFDAGFRCVKIPGHSIPFLSSFGKLELWGALKRLEWPTPFAGP